MIRDRRPLKKIGGLRAYARQVAASIGFRLRRRLKIPRPQVTECSVMASRRTIAHANGFNAKVRDGNGNERWVYGLLERPRNGDKILVENWER